MCRGELSSVVMFFCCLNFEKTGSFKLWKIWKVPQKNYFPKNMGRQTRYLYPFYMIYETDDHEYYVNMHAIFVT